MGGYMRFYCPQCDKIIDRRCVIQKMYEESFRCKWCGATVYSTRKLLARIMRDYVEYLEKHGEDMDEYQ
mgnify:CR=1 FL=1